MADKANAQGREEIVKQNAEVPQPDQIRQPLPANKKFGKNRDGYDIIPNEGK